MTRRYKCFDSGLDTGHETLNIKKNESHKGDFHFEMQMSFSTHGIFSLKKKK